MYVQNITYCSYNCYNENIIVYCLSLNSPNSKHTGIAVITDSIVECIVTVGIASYVCYS